MVLTISTSDRSSFKRCRQRWDFESPLRMGLKPIMPQEPLWFGSGIHQALAAYYEPSTPRDPQLAEIAWNKYCKQARAEYVEAEGDLWGEQEEHFNEMEALGLGMVTNYTRNFAPLYDDFEVIWIEEKYRLPILIEVPGTKMVQGHTVNDTQFITHIEGSVLNDEDRIVYYTFIVDALVRDTYGKYWILEFKTASGWSDNRRWLAMDDQVGSYIWAVQQKHGIKIEGVKYVTLMKKVPGELKELKSGKFSVDKRQLVTYDTAYHQIVQKYGTEGIHEYNEFLEYLQIRDRDDNPFVRRESIKRNQKELKHQQEQIVLEAVEMLNLKASIYRTPSSMNCNYCPFYDPCVAKYEDADYQFLLDSLYVKRKGESDRGTAAANV